MLPPVGNLPNRSAGQEARFPVTVIDLRLGAAPWRRMPSWSTSIVNRPAKSRASNFSAMAAPVSQEWVERSDTHQTPFGTSMGFAKGSTHPTGCADHNCSHVVAASAEKWPDDVRLSDFEGRYVCSVCGHRGADVRPDWQSKK